MVLVTIADLDDDVYPGVHDYAKCQSKAFMKGFIGFVAGGAAGLTGSLYARQRFASRFLPTYTVSAVAGGAIVFGYLAASIASRECQRNWVRTAQAAGYNSDDIVPAQTPEQVPDNQKSMVELNVNQDNKSTSAMAAPEGYDEVDASTFHKTKYGDTMG